MAIKENIFSFVILLFGGFSAVFWLIFSASSFSFSLSLTGDDERTKNIIFSKYASTGDGILTSLKMMEVMMARKKKMSELLDGLTIYPQVLENVRVTDKKAAQDDADVQAAVKAVTEALGDTGRILVRESGKEPLLRVMVEAETEEVCRKYVDQVVDVVKAKGHIAS